MEGLSRFASPRAAPEQAEGEAWPQVVGRARALGFSIEDCRNLLKLYEDDDRTSSEVKQIAEVQLDRIDRKIAELTEMRATLAHLVDACAGDHRPDCPILADLAAKEEEIALLNEAG